MIESVADAAAAASVTPDSAISAACMPSSERFMLLKLPRAREALIESVADAAAAASATPDRAINGVRAEQRAACAA